MVPIRNGHITLKQLFRGVFSNTNLEKLTFKEKPIFKKELKLIPGAVYRDHQGSLWVLTKHQNMYYCVYDNGVVQSGWYNLSEEKMEERAVDDGWVMVSDSFTKGKYE